MNICRWVVIVGGGGKLFIQPAPLTTRGARMREDERSRNRCIFCECIREDRNGKLRALCRLFGWRDYPEECNSNCPYYEEL